MFYSTFRLLQKKKVNNGKREFSGTKLGENCGQT